MHSGGCAGTAEYYRNTRETLLVQKSTTGAIGRLCWYYTLLERLCCYSRVPLGHWGSCAGTEECYRSTREAVLVQQITIGALGRICWYREYYWSTRDVVLVSRVL